MTRSEIFLVAAVVVVVLLGVAGVAAFGQETYTVEQVKTLILQRGVDWAAGWISNVYNSTPSVTMPDLRGEAKESDFIVTPAGPITVAIDTGGGKMLRYSMDVGPWTFKGSVPQVDPWAMAKAAGLGVLVGFIAGVIVDHSFLR